MVSSPVYEDKRGLMELMGMTLVVIQTTESLIALCMNFVLQDDPPMTSEKFHRLVEKQRSTTLGNFLNQLRRRVALDDEFDARLSKFLEMRNQFVHGLFEVKGLSFDTKPGLEVADIFVRTLATDATYFIKVFAGIIREWQEQQGWPSLIPVGAEALFNEIDAVYKPLANEIFLRKD